MEMIISKKDTAAADNKWIDVTNPATGEKIDTVPWASETDVNAAVESADEAFFEWAKKPMRDRGMILYKAARLIREQHKDLARLLTIEQGKPLRESIDEVRGCANILEYYASISGKPAGEAVSLGKAGDCMVTRVPLGVCAAIIPWNMPVIIMGWKVGPALLAGNSLILKPSSRTPLTCLKIARMINDAGLPEGILNVVTGPGDTTGTALIKNALIKKISFTGDTATGSKIREMAIGHVRDLTLELGGSDPMIVMDDANIPKAVEGALRGRFYNAGQICTAVKRLYLHEKIADEFMRQLKSKVDGLTVGNGLTPGTDMGPLAGSEQMTRISSVVQGVTIREEGTILTGGCPSQGKEYEKGFFYEPTLIADVAPDASVLKNEIFGPVLPVMTVPDLDCAIQEANNSKYGLGASVWTRNIETIRQVYLEVNAGIVWVNRHLTVPPEIPFGGTKESGVGRENGFNALDSYTQTKTLYLGW
ncbi:MAG: aldehyde dehydrogenase family protein [Methanoregula sp.]|jgi:acyl-CoA reductase-like NAD-dependent aldehyde dehydrogenase